MLERIGRLQRSAEQMTREEAELGISVLRWVSSKVSSIRDGERPVLEISGFPDVDATYRDTVDVRALLGHGPAKVVSEFIQEVLSVGIPLGLILDRLGRTVEAIGVDPEQKEEVMADIGVEFIKAKAAEVGQVFADGFQFKDLLDAALHAMEIVQAVQGLEKTGVTKKDLVKQIIREAYQGANPNIPWIPEPFETWLENWFLKDLLDVFIDKAVAIAKGKFNID